MKRIIILGIILFAFFSTIVEAQNNKKQKKAERYQKVLELINSKNFEFIGRKANPQGGRQIDLTTRINSLKITGDKATADLPYFGRAFSGGYGDTGGSINFDGPYESYTVNANDKKARVTITFKVKGPSDTYNCTLTLSSLDNATLTVSSNKRQTIRYHGFISGIHEK